MSELFDVKNLPDTVKTLSRGVITAISYKSEPIITDKHNQSFSVSKASKRVKLDLVDTRLLVMRTNEQKLVKAAGQKPQDKSQQPRQLVDLESGIKRTAIQRIDRKLVELGIKLIKAIRQEKDTTVLDSLILRCQYQRKLELEKLWTLADKADEKANAPLVGQIASEKAINVGHIDRNGQCIPNGGLNVPIEKLAVGEIKPIVPAHVRSYKVKRNGRSKVIRDRLVKHGTIQAIEQHIAIKPRSKPRKSKASAKRGAGSY